MRNAMVASSKRHAAAMISWLKLNDKVWIPLAYGDEVKEVFQHAKIVRPSEGVLQAHCDWVLEKLVPNLALTVTTIPPEWKIPQENVA